MGVCMSAEQKEAAARSATIDRQLSQARAEAENTVKLLLLGWITPHLNYDTSWVTSFSRWST